MRASAVVTLVLFAIFLLIVVIWTVSQRGPESLEAQYKLTQLRQAVGLFLASAATLCLLVRALAGDAPGKLVAFVIALFAAILLNEPNWGIALGLAAISIAVALRAWLPAPHRRLPTTAPAHEPPVL
jgi:hypothetical protein